MDYSVRRKEFYAYIYPENILGHALIYWLRVLNSFLFLFSFLSFLSLFRIIYYGFFYHFLHPRVDQVLKVLFFCFSCLFLNLPFLAVRLRVHCSDITSTLMWSEGSGQHLMRRQQHPQIFVSSHSYPLFDIFSFTLLQGFSEALS